MGYMGYKEKLKNDLYKLSSKLNNINTNENKNKKNYF